MAAVAPPSELESAFLGDMVDYAVEVILAAVYVEENELMSGAADHQQVPPYIEKEVLDFRNQRLGQLKREITSLKQDFGPMRRVAGELTRNKEGQKFWHPEFYDRKGDNREWIYLSLDEKYRRFIYEMVAKFNEETGILLGNVIT